MSSGSKGLHIHIPIKLHFTFDVLKPYVKGLAEGFANVFREDYTTKIRKDQRNGRIFIDYLHSLRATKDAAIAMPLAWDSLIKEQLKAAQCSITNYRKLLMAHILVAVSWTAS